MIMLYYIGKWDDMWREKKRVGKIDQTTDSSLSPKINRNNFSLDVILFLSLLLLI